MVGHTVGGTSNMPEISFDMVGTTGNLYKTVIGKVPSCDCPDAMKGNQCKHIFYGMFSASSGTAMAYPSSAIVIYSYFLVLMAYAVLVNALKAPEHLQYQLAFLSEVSWQSFCDTPG